eukprot:gb/GFBE01044754.1/.p1 GENE.gb/GFBE01044754.1/~~gb/GFBE01044754.1/.p1  ORF type:complete len:521 (+),score=94.90 gb/GFBE01044754.1/:1-1563(+)
MIRYSTGSLGIFFICKLRGSVFPRAFSVAAANAILAIVCHIVLRGTDIDNVEDTEGWGVMGMGGTEVIWSGYTFVLGFLIVFRNNQAYMRFWDGAMMIAEIRGNWYHAVSNLIAFCSSKEEKFEEVEQFQHFLVRLASMLFCASLQRICDLQDDSLEILDVQGIDTLSLEYLGQSQHRCEVLMQWLQQHIVDAKRHGVIDIEAPILSRVFQELTNGIVQLNRVQNIKDIPFPFPYAQMISAMLIVHWIVTPLLACQVMQSAWWAGALCFCTIGSFWSLVYIAREIDQPFGDDANDLPVQEFMQEFNEMLFVLLHPMTQARPQYVHLPGRAQGLQRTWSEPERRTEGHSSWKLTEGMKDITVKQDHLFTPKRQSSPISVCLEALQQSQISEDVDDDREEPDSLAGLSPPPLARTTFAAAGEFARQLTPASYRSTGSEFGSSRGSGCDGQGPRAGEGGRKTKGASKRGEIGLIPRSRPTFKSGASANHEDGPKAPSVQIQAKMKKEAASLPAHDDEAVVQLT